MSNGSIDGRSGETYAGYADIYDVLFDDLKDDVAFYLGLTGTPDDRSPVLELGAGTGRVTEALLAAGHRVTAVDLSPEMLAKAAVRLARFEGRARIACADARQLALGERFAWVLAPYGMVAHLVGDEDRRAAFRAVFEHLQPGGRFVFDDCPSWMAGRADGQTFAHLRTRKDPVTGNAIRLLSNCVDLDDPEVTLRHDFVDWLDGDRVVRRIVVRIMLRNVPLEDDLAMLRDVGFGDVELFGGFDARPLDRASLASNKRLIVSCRRAP